MTPFMGSHVSRLDSKGRVSIPAPFRAVLKSAPDGDTTLILRQSHKQRCIEAWPAHAFHSLAASLQQLDVFSDDQDDLAFTIYGGATEIAPDRDGRVVLPEELAQFAELGESVAFIGTGRMFQLWEPQAAERRRAEANERVVARNLTLPGRA